MRAPGTFGSLVLFGSGETGEQGLIVQEPFLAGMDKPIRVAVIETPAGFQPNVDAVTGTVRSFFEQDLQRFSPVVTIVPARRKGTSQDPDDPAIAALVDDADVIFSGAGSPTYAARQLAGTATLAAIRKRWHEGALLVLASASAMAAANQVAPVYEIIVAGEDFGWRPGFDLLGDLGLRMAIMPHWNFAGSGTNIDTSCCFLGAARFTALMDLLPKGVGVLGIDEHTAVVIDPATNTATVRGAGTATTIIDGNGTVYSTGEQFSLVPFMSKATV